MGDTHIDKVLEKIPEEYKIDELSWKAFEKGKWKKLVIKLIMSSNHS